ncbi:MAG: class I SAM-dependent methyltransferase [Gemmatimonadaceae bacterium]|nr:class I SAM-dependent methyltransferase [Gemmatimonadaceae bacterium]
MIALLFGPVAARTFDVRYWDGTVEHGGAATTGFRLGVNRPGALRRMLLPPSELSIVESHLSGDVDIDGALESAMGLADEIGARVKSPRVLVRLLRHLVALPRRDAADDVRVARSDAVVEPVGKPHDPSRDRAAIRFHYDVGNDFYALWLDQRMVYSCAYFRSDTDSIDEAQRAKLDLVCRKLRLRPGHRLLDVGCGWGALIIHAAQHYGVNALGITLSDAQASLARARIAAAGLADRCRVEIRDYRALPADMQFDRIASVGMIEHVGADHLAAYFTALHRALVPGGLLLNHGIVSLEEAQPRGPLTWAADRLWRRDAFIHQYVFPDGRLTAFRAVIAAAEAEGFETRDVESLREHYALTLRAWVSRLLANQDRAIALTSQRIFRIWRLYMTASAYAFAHGRINVLQTLLASPDAEGHVDVPMTWEDILVR